MSHPTALRPTTALLAAAALFLLACPVEPEPEPGPEGCGDGVVEGFEQCDDGEQNSNVRPDACRTDCTAAACGDGVVDELESCDDGGLWGGDGCSPTCHGEDGRLEAESNDDAASAEPLGDLEPVTGSLPEGDVDCFAIELPEDGWLAADVEGEEPGSCPDDLVMRLYDPVGSLLEVATPLDEGGCSPIDPIVVPAARFMDAGHWTLCLQGHQQRPVRTYRLTVELGDDTCGLDFPVTSDDDPDGDLIPNVCDDDDDGDGVLDELDDCPLAPNGGDVLDLSVDDAGFVRDWLLAGPFIEHETTDTCRPSDDQILGDDAAAAPELGDLAGEGRHWFAFFGPGARVNFLDVMAGPTAREVYAVTWIHSETTQTAVAALGPDDGARVWLNGLEIGDISGCQGTNVDQFKWEVELLEGWNRILVKVRDQGGGWGMYFRFLTPDESTALVDLGVSLSPAGAWAPDQSDLDGDGIGDVCDDTPAGEEE
jgi:cysteine-rich repeat protein